MSIKRKLFFTNQALKSLRECLVFLKEDLEAAPAAIKHTRKRILNKAEKLKTNPFIGQKEDFLNHLNQGHRRVIIGPYKVIYLLNSKDVIITDIFDCRQDPLKMKG